MLFCCLVKAIQLISQDVCTNTSLWQQMLCNVSTFNMTKAVEELYAQYPNLYTLILLNVCLIQQLDRLTLLIRCLVYGLVCILSW
jgi:hypothetical protein